MKNKKRNWNIIFFSSACLFIGLCYSRQVSMHNIHALRPYVQWICLTGYRLSAGKYLYFTFMPNVLTINEFVSQFTDLQQPSIVAQPSWSTSCRGQFVLQLWTLIDRVWYHATFYVLESYLLLGYDHWQQMGLHPVSNHFFCSMKNILLNINLILFTIRYFIWELKL